jgi:TolB protein
VPRPPVSVVAALAAALVAPAMPGCGEGRSLVPRGSADGEPPPIHEPDPDPCARTTEGAPWLVFASRRSGSYDLLVARADGTCVAAITSGPAEDLHPSWGPGDVVAFTSDRGGALRIWLHDLATGEDSQLAAGDLRATTPVFSPDGAWIAFEGSAAGATQSDVHVVAAEGGIPVAITSGGQDDGGPAWSPDAMTLYFVSNRSGAHDVYSAPAAGGTATRMTTGSRIVGRPVVTPDGAALLYARTVSGSTATEIVRLDLATRAVTAVSSQDDSEPAIDPSGTLIALRSFRSGAANLFVASAANGANALAITDDAASDGAPAFAPVR